MHVARVSAVCARRNAAEARPRTAVRGAFGEAVR